MTTHAPDFNAIASALADQKWMMLAALLIGLVVRLLKEDVKFLPTIASRWRPLVALALGLVASFLLALQPGVGWQKALAEGVVASFFAMGGHSIVIEALRGGREIGVAKVDQDAPTKPKLPPDPPSGASMIFVLVAIGALAHSASACSPAKSADGVTVNPARETARAIVLLVTEGVRSADELCASAGAATKDAKLLKTCADAYSVARPALISAAAHIDTWEGIERKDIACAIGSAVRAVDGAVQAMVAGGVKIPPLISDAIKLGAAFAGGSCS